MAEPGVGKSRLFFEFKATSQSGWMVLETFSVSHGKASAYLPVIDLLRNYFEITMRGRRTQATRERSRARSRFSTETSRGHSAVPLLRCWGSSRATDPLAQMDGQVRKRRTLEAIKRMLLRESLNQPLMMIFEDLHWIDDGNAGALEPARRLDRHREDPADGELSTRILATSGAAGLITRNSGSIRWAASAEDMLSALLGEGDRTRAAQAPHHRTDRG